MKSFFNWMGIISILLLTPYRLSFSQSLESSKLPIVLINTNGQLIPDEPRITAHMQIIYKGEQQESTIDAPPNVYDGRISIERRGSSSQLYPKKSFGLETQHPDGSNNNVSLLGMPEENDWILHAPFSDKSLMRNVLAYHIANEIGQYAARTRFCELVINGQYEGVYVLMEKLKRDKNRIDIAKLESHETEGEDLTGGYILKIDKDTGSGGQGWASNYPPPYNADRQIFFQYEYPKSDEIVPEQMAYIQAFLTAFENNLQSESFADSIHGYQQYIDVESFIDYMIVNEICKNIDAFRLSTFLHKHKDSDGGKLHIGPVWDFNFSLGNVDYCQGELPTGWVLDFNQICTNDHWLIPFWWERLMQDEVFNQKAFQRWQELRTTSLQTGQLLQWIDSQALYLEDAQTRNFDKWQILNNYVWPNHHIGGSYSAEIVYLKNWLSARLDWLDTAFSSLTDPKEDILGFEVVKIAPNPFNQSLQWTYNAIEGNWIQIELFDLMGKKINAWTTIAEQTGQNKWTWQQAHTFLPKGVYLYRFSINNSEIKREMILKQ